MNVSICIVIVLLCTLAIVRYCIVLYCIAMNISKLYNNKTMLLPSVQHCLVVVTMLRACLACIHQVCLVDGTRYRSVWVDTIAPVSYQVSSSH